MIGRMLVNEAAVTGAERPALDSARCIDARQAKEKCGKCAAVCPKGAIIAPQNGRVDWDLCVGCGLCAAVCPAEAFSPAEVMRAAAERLLCDSRAAHVIACRRTQAGADMKVWCLSSLRWEWIARLALEGRVELLHGDCEACERRETLGCLDKTLQQVRAFLGEERYARLILTAKREAGEGRGMTRRELFGGLLSGMKEEKPAKDADSEKLSAGVEGLRLSMVRRMDRMEEGEAPFGWPAPAIGEACWACGICEKICPNRAIETVSRDGAWAVACYPVLCTGCGTCGVICPEKAIDGTGIIRLEPGVRRTIVRVNAGVCSECGAAVRPGDGQTMCTRCRIKARSKRK